jgi:hypothetical protein
VGDRGNRRRGKRGKDYIIIEKIDRIFYQNRLDSALFAKQGYANKSMSISIKKRGNS